MPARVFRERCVTILVGLVLLFSSRLRKSLFFSDSVDSFTLHRIVSCFSNGLTHQIMQKPVRRQARRYIVKLKKLFPVLQHTCSRGGYVLLHFFIAKKRSV